MNHPVSESSRYHRRFQRRRPTSTRDQNASEADDEQENITGDGESANCKPFLSISQVYMQNLPTSQYLRGVQSDAVPGLAMVKPRTRC